MQRGPKQGIALQARLEGLLRRPCLALVWQYSCCPLDCCCCELVTLAPLQLVLLRERAFRGSLLITVVSVVGVWSQPQVRVWWRFGWPAVAWPRGQCRAGRPSGRSLSCRARRQSPLGHLPHGADGDVCVVEFAGVSLVGFAAASNSSRRLRLFMGRHLLWVHPLVVLRAFLLLRLRVPGSRKP